MLPFAFEVNNFFRSVKLLFHRGVSRFSSIARSVYAPLRFRSQPFFFVSAKFHFACVSVNRFPSSRGAFMLHPAPQVNHFFRFLQINIGKQRLFM